VNAVTELHFFQPPPKIARRSVTSTKLRETLQKSKK
jgi:hypothetical protein